MYLRPTQLETHLLAIVRVRILSWILYYTVFSSKKNLYQINLRIGILDICSYSRNYYATRLLHKRYKRLDRLKDHGTLFGNIYSPAHCSFQVNWFRVQLFYHKLVYLPIHINSTSSSNYNRYLDSQRSFFETIRFGHKNFNNNSHHHSFYSP